MSDSLNSRAVLREISANCTPNHELSPHIRSIIIGLALGGENASRIARRLKLPRTTVRDQINHYQDRDANQSKPRSGRPKSYGVRDERRVLRLVRQNPKMTWHHLQESLDLAISKRTYQRLLAKHGIRK
jgi:transposase